MKKSITFFILVMLISFVSCNTVSRYTIRVSVDRLPALTIVNQTGHSVVVTAPVASDLNNGGRTYFQPVETNQSINVVYRIGQFEFTEQATMNNADATVTLTRKPPTLTVVNNVGATINTIFMRIPGSPAWTGGNIVIRNGIVILAAAALTTDISGSIVNRDSIQILMGNIQLRGDRFDIRIDDVQGNTYVKNNVQIINDLALTFTASDRR